MRKERSAVTVRLFIYIYVCCFCLFAILLVCFHISLNVLYGISSYLNVPKIQRNAGSNIGSQQLIGLLNMIHVTARPTLCSECDTAS